MGRRGGGGRRAALLDPRRDRIVSYVGKLIVSKGVDLLLAAWPLVVARVPEARLVIVGFGTYRDALGRFVDALRRRDLDDLLEIAARGRELEGGPPSELSHLRTFLEGAGDEWLARRAGGSRTGALHRAAASTRTCPTCCPCARPR